MSWYEQLLVMYVQSVYLIVPGPAALLWRPRGKDWASVLTEGGNMEATKWVHHGEGQYFGYYWSWLLVDIEVIRFCHCKMHCHVYRPLWLWIPMEWLALIWSHPMNTFITARYGYYHQLYSRFLSLDKKSSVLLPIFGSFDERDMFSL